MIKFGQSVSIGQRILLSSAAVLGLLLLSTTYSLQQFSSSLNSFTQLDDVGMLAESVMEVNSDLTTLQLDIAIYSGSRQMDAPNRLNESLVKLGIDLQEIAGEISNARRAEIIQKMIVIHAEYETNIEALKKARAQQIEFITEHLPEASEQMFVNLDAQKLSALENGNGLLLDRLYLVREYLLEAEVHVLSYQADRKYENQSLALQSLNDARNVVEETSFNSQAPEDDEANALQLSIDEYTTTYRQSIQATRGFLFLVNVVMAGEAEEFFILAAQLEESTLESQNRLRDSVFEELSLAQTMTLAVAVSALLFGLLLSFLVGRSISRPINEISKVFHTLSNGDFEGKIPGLSRKDEIGVLARSAAVFKDVSVNTKILLKEAEELADNLKIRELELKQKTLELEESNEQLDNFAYIASHDLKSPLRAIDSLASWIMDDCEDILPETSQEHLRKLRMRIERMEALLSDLLVFSRIGKTGEGMEPVSLAELMEELNLMLNVPEGFEFSYPKSDITLNTMLVSLKQVLLNLLSNSFKYVESEKGIVVLDWEEVSNDRIAFSISDNGPGIDPEFHEKVFKMFQTLNPRDVFEGSGMGLAIVKKIVEGVGGEISVGASDMGGAKFDFTWPKSIGTEKLI